MKIPVDPNPGSALYHSPKVSDAGSLHPIGQVITANILEIQPAFLYPGLNNSVIIGQILRRIRGKEIITLPRNDHQGWKYGFDGLINTP